MWRNDSSHCACVLVSATVCSVSYIELVYLTVTKAKHATNHPRGGSMKSEKGKKTVKLIFHMKGCKKKLLFSRQELLQQFTAKINCFTLTTLFVM